MSAPFDMPSPYIMCYGSNYCPFMRHPHPNSVNHPTTFVMIAPTGVNMIPPMFPSGVPFPPRLPSIPRMSSYIPQFSNPQPSRIVVPADEIDISAVPPEPESEPPPVYEAALEPEPHVDEIVTLEPSRPAVLPPTDNTVNFSRFTLRFNGMGDVRPFIRAVLDFKDWIEMSDETALRGFPLLLTDLAAIWWQTNKDTLTTWNRAIEVLRSSYRARPQPYKLYRHLFSTHQKNEPTAVFVNKARALLNQLPPHTLTEDAQLDVVYGLLHRRIREKVNRNDCYSFTDLLNFAHNVEETLDGVSDSDLTETPNSPGTPGTPVKILPASGQSAAPTPLCEPNPSSDVADNFRISCQICKKFGHLLIRICQKIHQKSVIEINEPEKAAELHNKIPENIKNSPPKMFCVHCGSTNILRLKCQNCLFGSGSGTSVAPQPRPLLTVNIHGMNFNIVIDTGSRHCIATPSLTAHLVANNQQFIFEDIELLVDDGLLRQFLKVAVVDVWVAGVAVPTAFVDFPQAKEDVLGMDFIMNAGLVLDFRESGLWFLRDVVDTNPLIYETHKR